MNKKLKNKYYPLTFILPAFLIFTIFYISSIVGGFIFSFTDWNIINFNTPHFIGFENFKLLFSSKSFYMALKNVFIFAFFTTALKVSLGLGIALLLNNKFRGRNFFRATVFLPATISALLVGYVFSFILQPDTGILNNFFGSIGLAQLQQNWLGNPKLALYSIGFVETWMWTGFNVVIILAGLQAVPQELIEAARIDGATPFQTFKNITFPLIRSSINITITLCIIGGFNIFDLVMSMTNGGPNGATQVLSKLGFDAMSVGTLGYASAINLVQFLIIMLVIGPLLKFIKRKEVKL